MGTHFLPMGFEKLQSESRYVNLGKLPEGEHRFRILSRPIAGWVDWKDKKPVRFLPQNKPKTPVDPTKPVKGFWAMLVWDYQRDGLFIMEVTQNSVKKDLETLALSEDWGDLTSFDFKIKKEGSGIDTSYGIIPVPPKPISQQIREAVASTPVRLEALYEGLDPWKDFDINFVPKPVLDVLQRETIKAKLDQINDITFAASLEKHFNVSSIYDVDPEEEFDRVIKALETKLASKKTKEKVA
jgi:hypothetical protein